MRSFQPLSKYIPHSTWGVRDPTNTCHRDKTERRRMFTRGTVLLHPRAILQKGVQSDFDVTPRRRANILPRGGEDARWWLGAGTMIIITGHWGCARVEGCIVSRRGHRGGGEGGRRLDSNAEYEADPTTG